MTLRVTLAQPGEPAAQSWRCPTRRYPRPRRLPGRAKPGHIRRASGQR